MRPDPHKKAAFTLFLFLPVLYCFFKSSDTLSERGYSMQQITLYTTNCPACKSLKQKLDAKGIQYTVCEDIQEMSRLGISAVPMLKIGQTLFTNPQSSALLDNLPNTGEISAAQPNPTSRGSRYQKYQPYLDFISDYAAAANAATGSKMDANANVENKNVTTATGELYKADAIGINRLRMYKKISTLYGTPLAEEYLRQLEMHEIYRHDETNPLLPYCVSITMYPFLFDGLTSIGGGSGAPHNLDSFCGSFINLVFAISAQFAGAVSTPEFISYMDYFIRGEYGEDYYKYPDKIADLSTRRRSIDKIITDKFEQITYSLNQPAAARNFQSVFWNIAYFDKPYFEGMFGNFVFPDGSPMQWESVSWLQKRFMSWLNKERLRQPLTFPVESLNLLNDSKTCIDPEWEDFAAEILSKGHSFFIYSSASVDSLSSCCRLRNEMQDNTFSYTLGAGGVSVGSKGVITINMNRLIQNVSRECGGAPSTADICNAVKEQVSKIHRYLTAYNELLKESLNAKLLPVFDAGYISLEKEYLTIGINGFVEGAQFLGYQISAEDTGYMEFTDSVLKTIYDANRAAKTTELMFNTEYVPAENLGVKNAKWDKEDGYVVPRACYNSYFYLVEDEMNPVDKFILHGKQMTRHLDGGSALHLNLQEHLSKEQYKKLIRTAITAGCPYWTVNVPNTICNECGYISKNNLDHCERCGSKNVDWATRVIGYLKRVSNFSQARQKEAKSRHYAKIS